jgi:signal transduction histidine kinase
MIRLLSDFKNLVVLFLLLCTTCIKIEAQNNSFETFQNSKLADTVRLKSIQAIVWKLSSQNPDTALIICKQQVQLVNTIKNKLTKLKWYATIYGTIANAHSNQSNYNEALKYNFKSAKIKDSLGDSKRLANSYNNIANIYSYLNENEKALNYYSKALDLYEKSNSTNESATTLTNIGIIYLNTGQYKTARNYFMKSLNLSTEKKDSSGISVSNKYLANIFIEQKEYNQASIHYQKAYNYIRNQGLTPELASICINLGDLNNKLKNNKLALLYCDTAYSIVVKNSDDYLLRNIHQVRAEAYEGLKDYHTAYIEFATFKELNDTIFNTENKLSILAEQNKFEYALKEFKLQTKEQELKLLAKNTELKEIALRKEKYFQGLALVSSILVCLLLVLAMLYYNINKRKKQQALFSKKLIITQELERKRIAFELHDSVGQNLVFIKGTLENKELDKTELVNTVKLTLEEVRAISKDLYPAQLDQIGFVQSINALIKRVSESTNILATAEIDTIEDQLNPEQKINVYRIIQECITNCIKHANAKALRITVLREGKIISTTIQDNGQGFDVSNKNTSTGLISINERSRLLNGKISINSSINKGTKITLQIPIIA